MSAPLTREELAWLQSRLDAVESALAAGEDYTSIAYGVARRLEEEVRRLRGEEGAGAWAAAGAVAHVAALVGVTILDISALPPQTIGCSSDVYARLRGAFGGMR